MAVFTQSNLNYFRIRSLHLSNTSSNLWMERRIAWVLMFCKSFNCDQMNHGLMASCSNKEEQGKKSTCSPKLFTKSPLNGKRRPQINSNQDSLDLYGTRQVTIQFLSLSLKKLRLLNHSFLDKSLRDKKTSTCFSIEYSNIQKTKN